MRGRSVAKFVGRRKELNLLRESIKERQASLVVLRGRRRIGKSRLVDEFGKEVKRAYYFSGLAPDGNITADDQRNEFIRQLGAQQIPSVSEQDWGALFYDLSQFCQKNKCLSCLMKYLGCRKVMIHF